jgi:hypothetical protein
MSKIARSVMWAMASLTLATLWSQSAGWPRVVRNGRAEITVYEPQPDSLDGTTLQGRVAVSIKRPDDKAPLFGALWVVANLDIDRNRDFARVVSVKVDRTRFADVPESDIQSVVQSIEADAMHWDLSFSLSRLKAGPDYRNDPPKIVVVDHPAILLLLEGEPRLEDTGSAGLQQVVNTALPVIFDTRTRQYWFFGSSVWFTTKDLLRGAWTPADRAPANIADLVKDANTLGAAQTDAGTAASAAQLRNARIIVATEPTELIVTEGTPKYSPLAGGELLYVTNTDGDIFMEVASQRHFIAISGRWFSGLSMQGPWTFVAPENLPRSFAAIPENSPKADALAFVPGTDRAKDALMDNAIPQTTEISRKDVKIDVQYDGSPQFSRIPNTSLEYAENTPFQIIRGGGRYYACDEGVWYVAPTPTGPWSISDVRPVGIEGIPPSSPVYNTKYVYIYSSTPDLVYVGYLPGYRWSLPYHGVVYYGTGWRYRGWFGRYYYPRPATWGFYARYDPWNGWTYGMSWRAGWLGISSHWGYGWAGWGPGPGHHPGFWSGYHPGGWFGPGGYRPPYWHPPGRPAPGRPGIRPPRPVRDGNNLYHRPGRSGVRPRPETLPVRPGAGTPPKPSRPGIEKPGGRGPGRPGAGAPPRPTQPNQPGMEKPGGRGPGRPGAGAPSRPPKSSGPAVEKPRGRRTDRPDGAATRPGRSGGGTRPSPTQPGSPNGEDSGGRAGRPGGAPTRPEAEPVNPDSAVISAARGASL